MDKKRKHNETIETFINSLVADTNNKYPNLISSEHKNKLINKFQQENLDIEKTKEEIKDRFKQIIWIGEVSKQEESALLGEEYKPEIKEEQETFKLKPAKAGYANVLITSAIVTVGCSAAAFLAYLFISR